MATPAEEAARKKHEEEKKRLRELGISTDRVLPDAGPRPPEVEDPMSNIDEIAASEAPYDDGYVEPELSEQDRDIIKAGEDAAVLPTEEEMEEIHSEAKSGALAEGREEFYKQTGRLPEDIKHDEEFEKGSAEFAEEQQTFEEGQAAFKEGTKDIIAQDQIDHEERVKNNPYTNNPKDARHIEELEYREERLRQLGSGMSRGDIAAANNPMLQQAIADKAAREAAKPSIEEKAGIANKKTTAMDDAMRKAGHEVDRGITPTFINPDTGKEEGGAHYVPSKHDVINVRDDAGNIVGQKVVRKKDAPEDPDKPSPEEMKSRRDAYANKIREDAVAQKAERKRQGMLLRGDTHALGELDRQTAEDAATRLRDAEAAIRAREDLTANEQAIKIQELKNTGALDVTESEVGGRSDVATTQAGADMHASDAGVEIAAGQNQSAETINAATLAAQAASQESQQEFNLELTSLNNQQQTDFQTAQNAHASSEAGMDRAQQATLLTMTQDFQAGESQLDRDQQTRLEELRHLHNVEGATLNHDQQRELLELTHGHTASEAQLDREQVTDLTRTQQEREDLARANAADQAIVDSPEGRDPIKVKEAQARLDAAAEAARPTGGPAPAEVSVSATEATNYLLESDPPLHQKVADLANDWIDDHDSPGNPFTGSSDENFIGLANDLRSEIAAGNITEDNLEYVAAMLKSKFHVDVMKDYQVHARAVAAGQDIPGAQGPRLDDAISYLEEIFAGRKPINVEPTGPAVRTGGSQRRRRGGR